LKQWVEIENFSGKSVLSIKQDFHAEILAMNLAIFGVRVNTSKLRLNLLVLTLTPNMRNFMKKGLAEVPLVKRYL